MKDVKVCVGDRGFWTFRGSNEDLFNWLIDKLIAGRVVTLYAEAGYLNKIKVSPPEIEETGK